MILPLYDMMKRILLIVLAAVVAIAASAKDAAADSTRVLFVGNSYTYYNDMPAMLRQLAASAGGGEKMNIAFTAFTPGGCSFRKHVENPALIKALADGGWDYVVLQEQSSAPARHSATVARDTYPYAHILDSLARAGSPGAKVIFYMTWGHKPGCLTGHKGYPMVDTYEGMQLRLAQSYLEMAYDNDARCAPVGLAWRAVRAERPDLVLYRNDRSHPSRAGSYLAACVIYATMLGRDYQSNYTADLDPMLCEYLQQVALRTVLDNKKLLNIEP